MFNNKDVFVMNFVFYIFFNVVLLMSLVFMKYLYLFKIYCMYISYIIINCFFFLKINVI